MDITYQPFTQDNNWIVLTFLFILMLLIVLKKLFKSRFNNQLKLLNNALWVSNLKNNYSAIYNLYNLGYLIILCFLLSFITLVYIKYSTSLILTNDFYFFLKYSLYFGAFFVLKHLFYYLFSLVFNLKTLMLKIVYVKTSYLNFLSIFILSWLSFVLFSSFENNLIFKIASIISLLLALYFYTLIIKNNLKVISKHFFYFILYLCTLEIAPIIILYKAFFLKV
jgi:uncharacterized protein DUF4271